MGGPTLRRAGPPSLVILFRLLVARFGFCLLLALAAALAFADDFPQRDTWLFAPRHAIGTRIEHWADVLGPDYDILYSHEFPNRRTKEPMVFLRIGDRQTMAAFVINLTTDEQRLVEVQSSSADLLEALGIGGLPLERRDPILVMDDWDAGLNRMEIVRKPDGTLAAHWIYHQD